MSGIYWSDGVLLKNFVVNGGKRRSTVIKIELEITDGSWELDGIIRQLRELDAQRKIKEDDDRAAARAAAAAARRRAPTDKGRRITAIEREPYEPTLLLEDRRDRR